MTNVYICKYKYVIMCTKKNVIIWRKKNMGLVNKCPKGTSYGFKK